MSRLRAKGLWWTVVVLSVAGMGSCGGHKPPGISPFPARINLTPGGNTSLQLGSTLVFTATAQNFSNGTVPASFTFTSSDTSILSVAPNGNTCAGHWDAAYVNCTPGGTGLATVTASALGISSVPTLVFVHPPIDNITVTGVLLNGSPIQEPCLSQGQTMTVEAHAFSQGTEVTQSVGPFTWSANNGSVVTLTPISYPVTYNNVTYIIATNQATAAAVTPGITEIYATASGVTSMSFQQPPPGTDLSFFETCPIQNITLELGHAGSGQTSFAAAKGTTSSETVIATVTDVMGNSSLPNTYGGIVLNKIPLTWTSSQPQVVGVGSGCTLSCALTLPSSGAAAITASCSPPNCNVGFPVAPPGSIPPVAVYASPLPNNTTAAISGLVTGATSSTSVLATSMGCGGEPPADCTTSIYNVSTAKATAGGENPMPVSPNSFLFDLGGDKVYMGSDFGAQVINPGNFGTTTSAFTPLGTVTGKILAISANGSQAIFSDTLHVPNQVYVVNTTSTSSTTTALNISRATAAAFSPDGFKAFIFGCDSNNNFGCDSNNNPNPTLYVYSALQALQTIPLPAGTTVNSIVFSSNAAFAYVVEPSLGGGGPAFTVYNTCDNQISTSPAPGSTAQTIPLTAPPVSFKALPDGVHFVALESSGDIDYITASVTGIPAATLTSPSNALCPMTVSHTVQKINLGQGSIHPIDFFPSPDGTLLYVVASDRSSILVYNFVGGGVNGGIELAGNATPVSVDASVDGGTIVVAGSDGQLHLVSTGLAGSDQAQVPFPNLPNYLNPFCTFNPAQGACTLDFVGAKP
jgi:hypothetical protein